MTSDTVYTDAVRRFGEILRAAEQLSLVEPTAVALATATPDGHPSVRMVLMRGWDERGYRFFTNEQSRKGRELAENPRAALCFYWEPLRRQIRIEGTVEAVSQQESDEYWAGRPRESRISAWASDQSQSLEDWQTLVDRVAQLEARYEGHEIPRPPHWRGYRVVPERIEFWHGLPARLHERDVYELVDGEWSHRLLYP
jgi:pyridoxamine 5'-phosphate oxidase